MSLLQFRPRLTAGEAEQLVQTYYHLTATATPLPSERDQNFLLTTESSERFVLKIANALEKRPMLELENAAMSHLARHGICCPQIKPTATGETIHSISRQERQHLARLVTYLPGKPLAEVEQTPELLAEIGRLLGHLSNALHTFDHPAAHRDFHWDMQQADKVIRQYLPLIQGEARQSLVHHFLAQFEVEVLPALPQFRTGVLYNDANDYNVLVDNGRLAVLDFGDMVYSRTVFDLAIGLAYALLGSRPSAYPHGSSKGGGYLLDTAAALLRAYHEVSPLTAVEMQHLYSLIAIRWCTSVAVAAHQMAQEPDNAYLAVSQAGAWAALAQWREIEPQTAHRAFREAGSPGRDKDELLQLRG